MRSLMPWAWAAEVQTATNKTESNRRVKGAENSDRQKVYEAIAAKEGTSPELVGRRRALQIAENASAGTWLQAADGSWSRK